MGKDNAIHTFLRKISFSSKGQNKSKLQKQISKISILLVCFCSFDLFCPLLEKYNFIENLCIALYGFSFQSVLHD